MRQMLLHERSRTLLVQRACAALVVGVAVCALAASGASASGRHSRTSRDALAGHLGQWVRSRVAQAEPAWQVVASPARGLLLDVSIVSPDEAWAVGMADAGAPGEILRYRDGAWRLVASDPSWILWAVEAVSVDDVWIAGFATDPLRPVLLHAVDGALQRLPDPPCATLIDLHFVGPRDGWAVGNFVGSGGQQACILHYRGERWERVGVSSSALLVGVEMAASDLGWAIGSQGETVRFSSGVWTEVPSPALGHEDAMYYDLDLVGASEGWAVGTDPARVLHLAGGRWQLAETGLAGRLFGVTMLDAYTGWFVGSQGEAFDRALMARYAGGAWAPVPPSGDASSLTAVRALDAESGWAVGAGVILRLAVPPTPTPTTTDTPSPTPTDTPTPTLTPTAQQPTATATVPPTGTTTPRPFSPPAYLPIAGRERG